MEEARGYGSREQVVGFEQARSLLTSSRVAGVKECKVDVSGLHVGLRLLSDGMLSLMRSIFSLKK